MICPYCNEPVTVDDELSPSLVNGVIAHWECGLRAIVGGINHLNGLCTCCGGTLDPDPKGVSKRMAAKMAAQAYMVRHPVSNDE